MLAAFDEPFLHHLRSFLHFLSTTKLQYLGLVTAFLGEVMCRYASFVALVSLFFGAVAAPVHADDRLAGLAWPSATDTKIAKRAALTLSVTPGLALHRRVEPSYKRRHDVHDAGQGALWMQAA
jgi:hypothetical protein